MQSRKLITVLAITSLLSVSTTTVSANDTVGPPTCDEVLSACDKALNDQLKLNHEQQRLIKNQEDLLSTQREKIDELNSERDSIFRNPWFWFGVGTLTGVLITK